MNRMTHLIIEIFGGQMSVIKKCLNKNYFSLKYTILLKKMRINRILGFFIQGICIKNIFIKLEYKIELYKYGWKVFVPIFRSDLKIDVDIIEDIVRMYVHDSLGEIKKKNK